MKTYTPTTRKRGNHHLSSHTQAVHGIYAYQDRSSNVYDISVIPSSRDLMIKMAISALSELTEELKTLLAPQEHEPFFLSFGDDLQGAHHISYYLLELQIRISFTNKLLFLQAELETR